MIFGSRSDVLKTSARSLMVAGTALALAGCVSANQQHTIGTANARADKPSQPESILRLARAARAARDYASAVNLFRSAEAADPKSATILVELGDTLAEAGSYDDANYAYSQISPQSPMRLRSLLGLMRVALDLNQSEKALTYADAARAIAPQDIEMLIGRGVVLDTIGRHAEAQASYRTAITSDSHNVAARSNLALSLALTGGFDEAIQIMEPIALSSNATPRLRQNLALIYGLAGDDAQATSVSKIDLDAKTIAANLHFFDIVRSEKKLRTADGLLLPASPRSPVAGRRSTH